jgi:uncharacterized damage-inducible protein DinB
VIQRPTDLAPTSERDALTAFLDRQRDILVRKVEGLTDDEARAAPTVSSLSLLGIIKHCALWERRWFQVIFAGRSFPGDWPEVRSKISTDFEVGPDDTVQYWLRNYKDQVQESRRIVAAADLDARCALPGSEDRNLRWVLLHHIEEVARHAGQADIIRETIDGSTGE